MNRWSQRSLVQMQLMRGQASSYTGSSAGSLQTFLSFLFVCSCSQVNAVALASVILFQFRRMRVNQIICFSNVPPPLSVFNRGH